MKPIKTLFFLSLLVGVSSSALAASCDNLPTWTASGVYTKGLQVQLNRVKYEAKWWTQSENPEQRSTTYDVWLNQGDCDSTSSAAPSSAATTSSIHSSISSVINKQQCNWYGTLYPLCTSTASGWGWENNTNCIAAPTCSAQPAPYGIVGGTSSATPSSVAVSSTPLSSSVVSSVKSSTPLSSTTSSTVSSTKSSTASSVISAGGKSVIGYFVEWGVYGRNYHVKNIETSGSANVLTHIVYAFGNVTNGQCVIGDSYADYDKAYDAAGSVDGVADTWDAGALRGSFGQLRKLKKLHPGLKVLWSFGGWTWSGGFPQAAANPSAFAESCYKLVKDPRWADVFDGIDIDWEYPNDCGLSCDATSGFSGYKNLLQALRSRFGADALVTSAIAAGTAKLDRADYAGAAQYVDFYNPMSYDYFGAWDAKGPTAPHSPLFDYAGMPIAGFSTDTTIKKLISLGVPRSKINLGVGFYGRGWTGVTQATPGGSATGPAPGTYEAGIEDYKVLKTTCPANLIIAGTAYGFCNGNWWNYDTPTTLVGKMDYVNQQNLGGTFFWELSGDTNNGELIHVLKNVR